MRRNGNGAFGLETVVLLIKEALYLADDPDRRELRTRIRRIFSHLVALHRDRLREAGVSWKAPTRREVSRSSEQVIGRMALFVRALMGFAEDTPAEEVRARASLFPWRTYLEPGTVEPILLHIAPVIEAAVLSRVVASLAGYD